MRRYIDCHTHHRGCEYYIGRDDVYVVQSLMAGLESPHPRADAVTIGFHPMQEGIADLVHNSSDLTLHHQLKELIIQSPRPVIGLGECGYDRRSSLSVIEQDWLFQIHINLSEELKLPIIIHNVGGTHRLLALRKQRHEPKCRWWIHGFAGKEPLFNQLIDAGISVSLHPIRGLQLPYLSNIPAEHLRLETDDSGMDIRDVYETFWSQVEGSALSSSLPMYDDDAPQMIIL